MHMHMLPKVDPGDNDTWELGRIRQDAGRAGAGARIMGQLMQGTRAACLRS